MSKNVGIIPILTTFVNNKIDKNKLINHGEHILKGGMDYLFLAGTTGLGPSTSINERKYMLDSFSNIPDNIILQVGSLNLEDSMELTEEAKKLKIHAVGALPPYYYNGIKTEWIIDYYVNISKIYPTMIYNYPATTGYNITYDMINEINRKGGNIVGIKETTFNLNDILNVKYYVNDVDVYTGPDEFVLSSYKENLDGYVSGAGNYAYDILKKMGENYDNNDGIKYQILLNKLVKLSQKYGVMSSIYDIVEIMKGYNAGEPREPFFKLSENDHKNLENEINELLSENKLKM